MVKILNRRLKHLAQLLNGNVNWRNSYVGFGNYFDVKW